MTRLPAPLGCLGIALVVFAACTNCRDLEWQNEVAARPWLAIKLSVAAVPQARPPSGVMLDLHGLKFLLPAGMAGSIANKVPVGSTRPTTYLHIVDTEYGNLEFDVFVTPYKGEMQAPSSVKPWTDDFAQLKRRFATDFDLIEAAYGTVPEDVDRAGDCSRRRALRTLLMVKNDQLLPASEVLLPKVKMFFGTVESKDFMGDIFDDKGECRAKVVVVSGKPLGLADSENIESILQLFYYASF